MRRFPVIDVDNNRPQVDRTAPLTIDLTLDSDEDDHNMIVSPGSSLAHMNSLRHNPYAGPGIYAPTPLPGVQSKRKRPGTSSFAAWPPSNSNSSSSRQSVIVLDDSENELERSSSYKKSRQDKDDDFDFDDDSEDYEGCHDGFTASSGRWKPLPDVKREHWEEDGDDRIEKSMEVEMSEVLDMLSVEAVLRPTESRKKRGIRSSAPNIAIEKTFAPEQASFKIAARMAWNTGREVADRRPSYRMNNIHNLPLPTRTRRCFMLPASVHGQALSPTSTFKQSPGSIARIIQREGCAVICSACLGGTPDDEEEEINAYTRDGALIVWHDGMEDIMTGHRRRIPGRPANGLAELYKHYTVNDVKFDPTSTSFVSSGNDKKVRVWVKEDDDEHDYVQSRVLSHSQVPYEIAFKPGTKKLAVAEKRIVIHSDYESSAARSNLDLSPQAAEHCVGDMIWGFGPTEQYIYASSEPKDDKCFEGYHKIFDVEKGASYDLDSKEAGDCLALTPDGSTLVHASRGPNRKHILRLYDAKRKNGSAVETVHMESFPADASVDGEVNSISISPDGIYIAIARIDNRTHVYDSRNIKKGKLFEYEHTGPSLLRPGSAPCGVPRAVWAETEYSRLTLISGGIDGSVRSWNPLEAITSPKNGIILAQVQSDIGYFSLGDRTKNEQQLIVGDTSGEVSILNSTKTYFQPL